ncbi:unnamed protein product [Effrenium voratum]|uniref:Uncharacterized protein n=1 Tax=Effrenium voratum TaxID=2562239 RepID=A0AA36NIF4_9DINO|nr:unnamed protein product [Effrenium voratum]
MLLEEAPIAVDSFDHPDPGLIFFCSHAHEDHLKGLHNSWRRGPLFTSPVTAQLLRLKWPSLNCVALEIGQVHRIAEGLEVEVSLIDANHIPGSVMFLFSGYFGTLLYTGDFRLSASHASLASEPLLRRLTRIFLDNTFCHPRFRQAERREVQESIARLLISKWPCVAFVAVYRLGKEPLLAHLAQRLKTKVLVTKERAAWLTAANIPSEHFQVQPCEPHKASTDQLSQYSMRGCIWTVSRKGLRKSLWHASACGIAAHGILPTGWAEQTRGPFVPGESEASEASEAKSNGSGHGHHGLVSVSDDGVCHFAYSDHCSFLELVQFLSFLPRAPVTFISPVPDQDAPFSYEGRPGLKELQHQAEVPSIRYLFQQKAETQELQRPQKRPLSLTATS